MTSITFFFFYWWKNWTNRRLSGPLDVYLYSCGRLFFCKYWWRRPLAFSIVQLPWIDALVSLSSCYKEISLKRPLKQNRFDKLLQAFYDQNEFVRDNEMVVLVDTEVEQVVDQFHLDKKNNSRNFGEMKKRIYLLAVTWCWSMCGGTRPEGNVPSDWVVRTEEFFDG